MKEKDLQIDWTKHTVYSKKARKTIQRLLFQDYGKEKAKSLWEQIQTQYVIYLEEAPEWGGRKNFHSTQIYDSVLVFAYYVTVPRKPDMAQMQKAVYDIFMGSFDILGRIFNVNRKWQMNLAAKNGEREKKLFPAAFHMEGYSFDKEAGIVRYYFSQCPNADFAKKYSLEDVLPFMCNCDHLALNKVGASLI